MYLNKGFPLASKTFKQKPQNIRLNTTNPTEDNTLNNNLSHNFNITTINETTSTKPKNPINNLKKLKELGLITGEKGEFTINPEIFWKGDTKTRQQVLEGKSLKVSFELVEE